MRRIVLHICLTFFLCPPLFGNTDFSKAQWEKSTEVDGISIYHWHVPDSKIIALKGEGLIEAEVSRVAQAIIDLERRTEWFPDYGGGRIVRWSSLTERIEYFHHKTPIVMKDRDFVLQSKATYEPATQSILFDFHSIEDPEVPPTNKVRGRILGSYYRLTPKNDGKSTHMEMVIHADPEGSVAKWIVNQFQKSYPKRMIEGLRMQCLKADVLPYPDIEKVYKTQPGK